MSDSDDTDVLLLVPPTLFIESVERDLELSSLQSQVVENLVGQVSELENRISFIESVNSSCEKNSFIELDHSMVLNESDACGQEDLGTPQDLVSPCCALHTCEINSNTESSLDLNHRVNGISKSKEALLNEIDVYLNNIDLKKKGSDSSSGDFHDSYLTKESEEKMGEDVSLRSPSFKRLDLPEVDRLLKEMENTQLEIESKLRMREVEYGIGGQRIFSHVNSRKSYPPVEGSSSSPERSSAPFTMYSSPAKFRDIDGENKKSDENKRDSYLVGSSHNSDSDDARKSSYLSGRKDFRSTSSVDARRQFASPRRRLFHSDNLPVRKPASGQSSVVPGSSAADLHRRDYLSQCAGGDPATMSSGSALLSKFRDVDRPRDRLPNKPNRNNILSLAELWKSDRDLTEDDVKKLQQKLEEEKFRRIHLEQTIQDLQKRVLEEEEKLAVAVKVDEGKDRAIAQISEAWRQMVQHWREIEAERHAMSQAVIKERALIQQKEDDLNKKVERWEKEVSQALDLAAGYKNKYEMLETELSSTIDANNEKSTEFERKLKSLEEELKLLYDERKILTDKLNLTQEEHEKEKQLVEVSQKELSSCQELLRNTEGELTIVKEQRDLLSTRLREEKAKSSNLEAQRSGLQETLEQTKAKLQESEEALRSTVGNFEKSKAELRGVYQSQLEAVVKEKLEEFQSQLDKAQSAMKAELSEARRLAQERASAQQQALVNSHAVEIKRIEAVYKEEIRSLENKLADSERRREKLESGKKEIAQRLHGVMEAQWQQALSILTSEISLRQGDNGAARNTIPDEVDAKVLRNISMDLESSYEEPSYVKEVPVSSDQRQSNQQQDTLLKYIQMLLEKQPGKPVDSASSGLWPDGTQSETFDESIGELRWNKIISNIPSLPPHPIQDSAKQCPSQHRKPPWK